MLRPFFSLLLLPLMAGAALAQAPCFDTNFGPSLALVDDQITTPLPLGFTFTFNGVAYNDISVCSNGYIILGSANVSTVAGGDYSPTAAELGSGRSVRVAVNQDMADTATPLAGGEEIAFFPPVTGG